MRIASWMIAGAAAGFLALPAAHAQDSQIDWTGPYVGVGTGAVWAHHDRSAINNVSGLPTNDGANTGGAYVGLLGGYDYMFPSRIVIGATVDGYRSSITGDVRTGGSESKATVDWFGTARLRAGYAINRFLPYVTGGLAWDHTKTTRDQVTGTVNAATPGTQENVTKANIGWTAGVGVDYAFGNIIGISNLVGGLEYRYSGFRDEHLNFPLANVTSTIHDNHSNTVLVSLTYHFGMTPEAPPATPVAAPAAPPPAAVAPSTRMFIVFFEFDKSNLTPDGQKVVDAAAAAYKNGKSDVAVAGYTDLAGSQQYNLALSHRRADMVKAALVKNGVPAAAVGESWFGKENPRVPTADGVREPQNRRVEVTM